MRGASSRLFRLPRLASSFSTAFRTNSVRPSPNSSAFAMRSKVPSTKRACISSAHRFFRPIYAEYLI